MGYIKSIEVGKIRQDIKKAFPSYKFSITREHYSTVRIVIVEAPIALEEGDINLSWLNDHYKDQPAELKLFSAIKDMANQFQGKGYETGDYGHQPNYYVRLGVGGFEKPFKVVQRVQEEKKAITTEVKKNLNTKLRKVKAIWNSKCAETGVLIPKGEEMYYDYIAKKCYSLTSNTAKQLEPGFPKELELVLSQEPKQEAYVDVFTNKEQFYCLN